MYGYELTIHSNANGSKLIREKKKMILKSYYLVLLDREHESWRLLEGSCSLCGNLRCSRQLRLTGNPLPCGRHLHAHPAQRTTRTIHGSVHATGVTHRCSALLCFSTGGPGYMPGGTTTCVQGSVHLIEQVMFSNSPSIYLWFTAFTESVHMHRCTAMFHK